MAGTSVSFNKAMLAKTPSDLAKYVEACPADMDVGRLLFKHGATGTAATVQWLLTHTNIGDDMWEVIAAQRYASEIACNKGTADVLAAYMKARWRRPSKV